MTVAFLLCATIVLVARAVVLNADAPGRARAWGLKVLAEIVTALALGLPGNVWSLMAIVAVLMNALGLGVDRARGAAKERWHLAVGVLHLGLLSWILRPELGATAGVDLVAVRATVLQQTAFGDMLAPLLSKRGLMVLAGLIWLVTEANLLVRWVLGTLNLKPAEADESKSQARGPAKPDEREAIDRTEYRRGRVIGILERALIYGFVLSGQLTAVGFTLIAKGYTRHKAMDKPEFAEYVLIGTLLSSGLAMLVALAVGQRIH